MPKSRKPELALSKRAGALIAALRAIDTSQLPSDEDGALATFTCWSLLVFNVLSKASAALQNGKITVREHNLIRKASQRIALEMGVHLKAMEQKRLH